MEALEIALRAAAARNKLALEWTEAEIEKGMRNVSRHFKDIHDKKLYLGSYETFEEYCQKRWGLSRQRGQQMIAAEETRLMLSDVVSEEPEKQVVEKMNERQLREVSRLPKEKILPVLRKALSESPKLTAKSLRKVINAETGKVEECCPTCKRPYEI